MASEKKPKKIVKTDLATKAGKADKKGSAKETFEGNLKGSFANGEAVGKPRHEEGEEGVSADKLSHAKPPPPPPPEPDASAFLSRLQIVAQYLKDLSFESPNAPGIFSLAEGTTPQFSLDINVKPKKLAPQRHEVTLILKVAMQRGAEVCFLVEIVYAGLVAVPDGADDHPLLQALLLIEVPRLLFPYARNILSELTQSSGFPPLVIQPVDFAALYRKHLAQASERASSPAP